MDGEHLQHSETMPLLHTYGSLFAGVGGFDLGFERAGWRCRFQVEWDKHCRTVLDRHWPDVPKWGDVSETKGYELPPVDCIIFGSPCQDLSVAGKRAGLDGARSGLFYEAMRVIKEMRDATGGTFPRWIVWENVAGAFSSNKGADFGVILNEMAEAGAVGIEWALLDAQHFGVPQRRRRVFVVACFDPATFKRCPDPLLPVSESVRGNTTKGNKKGKATADQVAAGFGSGSFGGWTETETAITLSARDHKSSNNIAVESFTGTSHAQYGAGVGTIRANGGDLGGGSETLVVEPFVKSRCPQSSTDDETWVEGDVNPTLNSFDVGETRTTTAVVGSLQARDHKGTNHEGARDGKLIIEEPMLLDGRRVDDIRIYKPPVQTLQARMGTGGNNVPVVGFSHTQGLDAQPSETAWPTLRKEGNGHAVLIDEAAGFKAGQSAQASIGFQEGVSQTINANMSGLEPTVLTPAMSVRRLTPIECERLMGWPDDWTAGQADTHRYKQCGNGVASPVAQWIAQHIRRVDEIQ